MASFQWLYQLNETNNTTSRMVRNVWNCTKHERKFILLTEMIQFLSTGTANEEYRSKHIVSTAKSSSKTKTTLLSEKYENHAIHKRKFQDFLSKLERDIFIIFM